MRTITSALPPLVSKISLPFESVRPGPQMLAAHGDLDLAIAGELNQLGARVGRVRLVAARRSPSDGTEQQPRTLVVHLHDEAAVLADRLRIKADVDRLNLQRGAGTAWLGRREIN